MDVTKPPKFIGFGAMDVTKPHKFMGFGAMDVTKPYKFIGFELKVSEYEFPGVGRELYALLHCRAPERPENPRRGTKNSNLPGTWGFFGGGSGAGLPCPIPGSRGSRAGIKSIYF